MNVYESIVFSFFLIQRSRINTTKCRSQLLFDLRFHSKIKFRKESQEYISGSNRHFSIIIYLFKNVKEKKTFDEHTYK